MRRAMGVRVAINPILILSTLFTCALILVFGILHSGMGCDSLDAETLMSVRAARENEGNESGSSSSSAKPCCDESTKLPTREKSLAQFLKEKAGRGHLKGDKLRRELEGLDISSQILLEELLQDLAKGKALAASGDKGDLFHFEYGVARIVRRLVVCSAYRISMNAFAIVTLSPDFTMPTTNPDYKDMPPKDPSVSRTCTWLAGDRRGSHFLHHTLGTKHGGSEFRTGLADFSWGGENHGTSYDVLIIRCTFSEPIGKDSTGGLLYLNFSHGLHFDDSSPSPATELVPVFRELPQTLDASLYQLETSNTSRRFAYEFAYCSAPVYTDLNPAHVKQFLMYHHSLLGGSVHFFIYYSQAIDDNTMAVLRPLINAGKLTVVDFRREKEFDTWYHSQNLALNDCLYRTRFLANWTLFWDLDEYLHVIPPLTLSGLLAKYSDAPSISFGKTDFSLTRCAPARKNATGVNVSEWAVERMLYREQRPVCGEFCIGAKGARKWMANPRKIDVGQIHSRGANWWDKGRGGDEVLLSTRVALIYHYRGLASSRVGLSCQEIHDPAMSNSSAPILEGKVPLEADFQLASIVNSTLRAAAESLPVFAG